MHLVPMFCPREEDLATFSQEIHKLSLKHCEIFKKGEFKHERLFRYLRIARKLEKFLRMQKLLEMREVAKELWKALPFPTPPPPPSGPYVYAFQPDWQINNGFFTVTSQSWRVLKSYFLLASAPEGPTIWLLRGVWVISQKNIPQTDSREKNSCKEILYLAKKDSYTEKNVFRGVWLSKKILQRGRCMSGKKNSITSGFGGKHSFPVKSPIPPTEPHPLPINVKWSLFLPVPLLFSSSVPSLPNVPLFLCSSCFVPC